MPTLVDEAPGNPSPDGSPSRSSVRVEVATDLEAELAPRWRGAGASTFVSVGALLNVRRAFWEARQPIPPTPEIARRFDEGRAWHRRLGELLPAGTPLELRVRRGGIVGRIDALVDRPIELKTTASALAAETIGEARSDYVDQLAIYCGLAERARGRLVVVLDRPDAPREVLALDVDFPDAERLYRASQRRADALRDGLRTGSPADLTRCPWFGRHCEYERAGVCDCRGDEPVAEAIADPTETRLSVNADESRAWAERLRALSHEPPLVDTVRELVFPRRAYFERTATQGSRTQEPRRPIDPAYARLAETLESGALGESAQRSSPSGLLGESIAVFRGLPRLLRVRRTARWPMPDELAADHPEYALELGLKSALLGTREGLLFLARSPPTSEPSDLRIVRYRFEAPQLFARLGRARASALRRALAAGSAKGLEPCRPWMARGCPYQPACGCAGAAPFDQR